MSTENARKQLETFIDVKIPVILWGSPGVGKSAIVKQIAEDRNIPLIDFRASLFEPIDFRGIPTVEKGRTIWNTAGIFPDAKRDGEVGIFFMDELPAAAEDTQKGLLQFALDRKLDSYTLPDGWAIVAAGNRQEDNCGNMWMSSALLNRFAHVDVYAEPFEWVRWAKENSLAEEVVDFIQENPKFIHVPPSEDRDKAYPTPRSWEMVSRAFAPSKDEGILPYIVGETASTTFSAFLTKRKQEQMSKSTISMIKGLIDEGKKSPHYKELVKDSAKVTMLINNYKAIVQDIEKHPDRNDTGLSISQFKKFEKVTKDICIEIRNKGREPKEKGNLTDAVAKMANQDQANE